MHINCNYMWQHFNWKIQWTTYLLTSRKISYFSTIRLQVYFPTFHKLVWQVYAIFSMGKTHGFEITYHKVSQVIRSIYTLRREPFYARFSTDTYAQLNDKQRLIEPESATIWCLSGLLRRSSIRGRIIGCNQYLLKLRVRRCY